MATSACSFEEMRDRMIVDSLLELRAMGCNVELGDGVMHVEFPMIIVKESDNG